MENWIFPWQKFMQMRLSLDIVATPPPYQLEKALNIDFSQYFYIFFIFWNQHPAAEMIAVDEEDIFPGFFFPDCFCKKGGTFPVFLSWGYGEGRWRGGV